jgi:hypothetical protein
MGVGVTKVCGYISCEWGSGLRGVGVLKMRCHCILDFKVCRSFDLCTVVVRVPAGLGSGVGSEPELRPWSDVHPRVLERTAKSSAWGVNKTKQKERDKNRRSASHEENAQHMHV